MLSSGRVRRLRAGITRRCAELRRDGRGDRGITLVEILIAMVLATVVGAMTMMTFLSANRSVASTSDRITGTAAARVTLQSWQALLGVATQAPQPGADDEKCFIAATTHTFEWITSSDALFYANVGNRDSSEDCAPPQLIWLAVRENADGYGTLLEAHYTYAPGSGPATAAWNRVACRVLSQAPIATITAGPLGLFGISGDGYGAAFASGHSPFTAVRGCADAPTSVLAIQISNSDQAANESLADVDSLMVSFVVANRNGEHPQLFESVASIQKGSSS